MPDYKRAILVGNSKFASLPALRCPGEDVEAMKQVLTDENICWFSPVYALVDAPHNEIFTRINEVLRDADKEDLVLIYYSGHGLLDNRGHLYLAANNTDPSLLHATAVSVSAIRDCLSQSRCQRFVLILDCCYAGAATADFRRNNSGEISTDFASGEAVEGIGEFVLALPLLFLEDIRCLSEIHVSSGPYMSFVREHRAKDRINDQLCLAAGTRYTQVFALLSHNRILHRFAPRA